MAFVSRATTLPPIHPQYKWLFAASFRGCFAENDGVSAARLLPSCWDGSGWQTDSWPLRSPCGSLAELGVSASDCQALALAAGLNVVGVRGAPGLETCSACLNCAYAAAGASAGCGAAFYAPAPPPSPAALAGRRRRLGDAPNATAIYTLAALPAATAFTVWGPRGSLQTADTSWYSKTHASYPAPVGDTTSLPLAAALGSPAEFDPLFVNAGGGAPFAWKPWCTYNGGNSFGFTLRRAGKSGFPARVSPCPAPICGSADAVQRSPMTLRDGERTLFSNGATWSAWRPGTLSQSPAPRPSAATRWPTPSRWPSWTPPPRRGR